MIVLNVHNIKRQKALLKSLAFLMLTPSLLQATERLQENAWEENGVRNGILNGSRFRNTIRYDSRYSPLRGNLEDLPNSSVNQLVQEGNNGLRNTTLYDPRQGTAWR